MGESKLTIEEETEVKKEREEVFFKCRKFDLQEEKMITAIKYVYLLIIIDLPLTCAKLGLINSSLLLSWYDATNNPPTMIQPLLVLGIWITSITLFTMIIINRHRKAKDSKRFYELQDALSGKIVNHEEEIKLQIEKLKKQMNQHFSIGMFLLTILVVYLVFNGTYGIKIESDNVFLNYLTNLCQNTIIHEVLAVIISVNAVLVIARYIQFEKLEKKQAKNAPPAEIPGTGIQ